MIRTQVYLTKQEKQQLNMLVRETGHSQSELIREAIDQLVQHKIKKALSRREALKVGKGLWEDRTDLPDFSALRKEWDERS